MNHQELLNVKAGDVLSDLSNQKERVIKSLVVKDFPEGFPGVSKEPYANAEFIFSDDSRGLCCSHCNGAQWAIKKAE